MKRIAIIGCGAAGISALRVFSEEIKEFPCNFTLCGLEKSENIGGIWNYSENLQEKFMSPIYKNLRINTPKEVLAYPDYPFPIDESGSFLNHKEILQYLINYSETYKLTKYIQYNSEVKRVEPLISDTVIEWKLTIENTKSASIITRIFDILIICNGHFDKIKLPNIKNMDNFKGISFHSKYYRSPEPYTGKTVFILGARSSGKDIALELTKSAKMVYLAHNKGEIKWQRKPKNLEETCGITEIDSDGKVCLLDGSKYDADVLIFCTGYEIDLSFISNACRLIYDNTYVRPLFKDFINPYFQSSFFIIGLGFEFVPFTHCYMQCKVARAIVQNCHKNISLITKDMIEEIQKEEEEFENLKIPMRFRHFLNTKQWPYLKWCENIAQDIMTCKLPLYLETMFTLVKKWKFENKDYREIDFELVQDNNLGFIVKRGPADDFYSIDYDTYLNTSNL